MKAINPEWPFAGRQLTNARNCDLILAAQKGGGGKAFILWSRLIPTGAGDAKLLVEVFLGLCSGVQQDLPRGVDRGLKLRL
jgi:hypothetical protein